MKSIFLLLALASAGEACEEWDMPPVAVYVGEGGGEEAGPMLSEIEAEGIGAGTNATGDHRAEGTPFVLPFQGEYVELYAGYVATSGVYGGFELKIELAESATGPWEFAYIGRSTTGSEGGYSGPTRIKLMGALVPGADPTEVSLVAHADYPAIQAKGTYTHGRAVVVGSVLELDGANAGFDSVVWGWRFGE